MTCSLHKHAKTYADLGSRPCRRCQVDGWREGPSMPARQKCKRLVIDGGAGGNRRRESGQGSSPISRLATSDEALGRAAPAGDTRGCWHAISSRALHQLALRESAWQPFRPANANGARHQHTTLQAPRSPDTSPPTLGPRASRCRTRHITTEPKTCGRGGPCQPAPAMSRRPGWTCPGLRSKMHGRMQDSGSFRTPSDNAVRSRTPSATQRSEGPPPHRYHISPKSGTAWSLLRRLGSGAEKPRFKAWQTLRRQGSSPILLVRPSLRLANTDRSTTTRATLPIAAEHPVLPPTRDASPFNGTECR